MILGVTAILSVLFFSKDLKGSVTVAAVILGVVIAIGLESNRQKTKQKINAKQAVLRALVETIPFKDNLLPEHYKAVDRVFAEEVTFRITSRDSQGT